MYHLDMRKQAPGGVASRCPLTFCTVSATSCARRRAAASQPMLPATDSAPSASLSSITQQLRSVLRAGSAPWAASTCLAARAHHSSAALLNWPSASCCSVSYRKCRSAGEAQSHAYSANRVDYIKLLVAQPEGVPFSPTCRQTTLGLLVITASSCQPLKVGSEQIKRPKHPAAQALSKHAVLLPKAHNNALVLQHSRCVRRHKAPSSASVAAIALLPLAYLGLWHVCQNLGMVVRHHQVLRLQTVLQQVQRAHGARLHRKGRRKR